MFRGDIGGAAARLRAEYGDIRSEAESDREAFRLGLMGLEELGQRGLRRSVRLGRLREEAALWGVELEARDEG